MKILTITLFLIFTTFSNFYPQNFWEKTACPDTTTIYSLAVSPAGVVFAGTDGNGIFRSTDDGDNWSLLGPVDKKVQSIFIQTNGDILIGLGDEFADGGIYRSADNGNTFDTLGIPEHPVTSIAINSGGDIFAGTASVGVYRSTDNGANWVQVNEGLMTNGQHPTSIIVNSSGVVFAGTINGGMFRSTNNGDNWIPINQGLTNNYILSLAIDSSGNLFAGTSGSGIFRSTDNGDNWTPINEGITPGQGLFAFSLTINLNGDIFAGTADGVFQSTDNGSHWIQNNLGLINNDVHSLANNSNGDIFAGTEDGIFRSNNRPVFPLSIYVPRGWNLLSIPGLHPVDQNTTTWWPGKDPTANVFKFEGSYEPVTTLEPGKGYWMKNLTTETYNYPVIVTVPNNPIPMTSGWNLFGVYECPVPVNELTTTPPGLISGRIYKYDGGYTQADTLYPGFAYWVKFNAAGTLNITPCTAPEGKKITEKPQI